MTGAERGRDQDPGLPVQLPDPLAIAELVATTSGNANMHPGIYAWEGHAKLDASFQVAGDVPHSGTAVVQLHYQEYGDDFDPSRRTDHKLVEAPIGHFLPGTDEWVLYKEYQQAGADQQQLLREHLDQLSRTRDEAGMADVQTGTPYIELRNPLTREMRRRTAGLLQRIHLDSSLIARFPHLQSGTGDGTVIVGRDESTTAFLTISGEPDKNHAPDDVSGESATPTINVMKIVHQGAILSPGDGTSVRGDYAIRVATQAAGGEWQHAAGILTESEWSWLQLVPIGFARAKQADPNFLADQCAVGFNIPDSYAAAA